MLVGGDLFKTGTGGVADWITESSTYFNQARLIGQKSAGVDNSAVVQILDEDDNGVMYVHPGDQLSWDRDEFDIFDLSKYKVKPTTTGDGIGITYFCVLEGIKLGVRYKMGQACRNLIKVLGTTLGDIKITDGYDTERLGTDTIVCNCTRAEQIETALGLWLCDVEIRIRTNAHIDTEQTGAVADRGDIARAREGYILDLFNSPNIEPMLENQEHSFSVQTQNLIRKSLSVESGFEDRSFVSTIQFQAYAAGITYPNAEGIGAWAIEYDFVVQ